MGKLIDLTGMKFGRLTVIERGEDYIELSGVHRPQWKCKCECNPEKIIEVAGKSLKTGNTQSCGCMRKETIHKKFKKYNDYEIQEDYVIMYTTKGEPFYVDLEDFWKVKDICWRKDKDGYLIGCLDNKRPIRLHRYIMDCPDNLVVDHINHDITDNRKNNLRVVTVSQNQMNRRKTNRNTSGIVGVCWNKEYNKWISKITVGSQKIHLGSFDNFDDAVKARKDAEEKYFGEFSYDSSQMLICNKNPINQIGGICNVDI